MAAVIAKVPRLDTPLQVKNLVARDEQFAQTQVTKSTLFEFARHHL